MNAWMNDRGFRRAELHRRHAAQSLKRCPLCNTLNARQNTECVTCRWHGSFDSDPFRIEEGLEQMMKRCPDFRDDYPAQHHSGPNLRWWRRLAMPAVSLWRRTLRLGLGPFDPSA